METVILAAFLANEKVVVSEAELYRIAQGASFLTVTAVPASGPYR
jgi:hypothetical protein